MKHQMLRLVLIVGILSVAVCTSSARYYDARIGRFLSVDPKAGSFASISPYAYALDNPLAYNDPSGKEPNKVQSTSPRAFLAFVSSHLKADASQTLQYLGTYATLGGSGPTHKRYLYTREGGWLDLVHVLGVAAGLDRLSGFEQTEAYVGGGFALWQKTKEVENKQAEQGSIGTAWSYEDAPSNYLGYIFWKFYFDPDGDIVQQLVAFLTDYGATDPQKAPNWKQMWRTEHAYKQQFRQNKSFSPMFTSEEEETEDDWWSEYDPSKR